MSGISALAARSMANEARYDACARTWPRAEHGRRETLSHPGSPASRSARRCTYQHRHEQRHRPRRLAGDHAEQVCRRPRSTITSSGACSIDGNGVPTQIATRSQSGRKCSGKASPARIEVRERPRHRDPAYVEQPEPGRVDQEPAAEADDHGERRREQEQGVRLQRAGQYRVKKRAPTSRSAPGTGSAPRARPGRGPRRGS